MPKISQLSTISQLTTSSILPVVDNNETQKVTLQRVVEFVSASLEPSFATDIELLRSASAITSSLNAFASASTLSVATKLSTSSFEAYTASIQSVNTSSLLLTSSFNTFTSSYKTDSSSFDSRIDNLELINVIPFLSSSTFNTFTSSYTNHSSSIDSRLDVLEGISVTPFLSASTFNSYTSSNESTNTTQNSRLTSLENNSGSYLLKTETGSFIVSSQTSSFITEAETGSFLTSLPNNLISGSVQIINLGFATTSSVLNIDTSSLVTTSSFNTFTSSYKSGSFTGSFSGSFVGNVTGTANNANYSGYVLTQNLNTNGDYSLVFVASGSNGYLQTYSDGVPGILYNPSTNRLKSQYISGAIEATNGVISGSSQLPSGIISASNQISSLGFATTSSILNIDTSSLVTTSSFNTYTASISTASLVSRLNQIESVSGSWITESETSSFALTANLPVVTPFLSSSTFNTFSASINTFTSSANTSLNNVYTATASLNSKTGSYATTGSNTFIGTETISGSLLLSGSFTYNGTSLQNGFTFAQPTLTRILDNASYTGASAWTTSYTGSGGAIIVTANVSGWRSSIGTGTAQLLRDGVAVASQTFYFNIANYHTPLPPIVYVSNSETGSHTYSIYYNNILADGGDYATINVLEYGNSAIISPNVISGSEQITNLGFATTSSVVNVNTSSLLLTSSFNAFATSSNTFSSSINTFTSSVNTALSNVYIATASLNSKTGSYATTGSNQFNGSQSITGSLTVTSLTTISSSISANSSSLYLGSGSNIYVQDNGYVEITGSLLVSGSATFNVPALIVNGRSGDEGGEINLAIPVTNTTLQNRVTTDVWQNRYRIFEGSANAKGVFVDLSKAPAGVGGELMWKASGLVNTGVDVTLGDLKARIPSTGNKSLQLSTTAGVTYSVYGSGIYTQAGSTVGTTINASSPLSVSSTPAYLASGYNFGTAGATDTWVIMDTSNTIAWRITMILGSGFNNNMISIERLV